MIRWHLLPILLLVPLGYYHSALEVARDFWSTYRYLPTQTADDLISSPLTMSNLIPTITRIFQVSFVLSLIYLIDRIPDIWLRKAPNRQVTTFYPSVGILLINQVFRYLSQIPNVITLSIGLVQAWSTWEIVWLEPDSKVIKWVLVGNSLSIIYIGGKSWLRWKRGLRLKIRLVICGICHGICAIIGCWACIPVVRAKIINVIVSLACFNLALWKEYQRHRDSTQSDHTVNSTLIWRKSKTPGSNNSSLNNRHTVRSDSLILGDEIWLAYGETTPATLKVVSLEWLPSSQEGHQHLPDKTPPQLGYVDNRESSGEDVSRSFQVGDILRPGLRLTRPQLSIRASITELRHSSRPTSCLSTLPNYLNRPWSIVDGFSIGLLCCLSLSISGSANQLLPESITIMSILQHILSTIIAGNILIPSMKMTLLYQVYNLVLSISFSKISIRNAPAIPKLSEIGTVIFDKTGTLTTDQLQVVGHVDECELLTLTNRVGWDLDEIRISLALANSESNLIPEQRANNTKPCGVGASWGTSPEECEILNYWQDKIGLTYLWNPLGSEEEQYQALEFKLASQSESAPRKIKIMRRLDYTFQYGKVSEIEFISNVDETVRIFVRQHGSDFFQNYSGSSERRSMTIAYSFLPMTDPQTGEPEWNRLSWNLATTYQFETPLRNQIPQTMKFLWDNQLSTSILTGDGKEAAEATGRDVGFPAPILRPIVGDNLTEFISDLNQQTNLCTVSLEGRHLEHWLVNEHSSVQIILNHPKACRIMSRVSKPLKARVVQASIQPMYLGDAANDLLAIQAGHVGVALAHGAEVCQQNADLIVSEPAELLDLLVPNGYRDMLLRGGELLLVDVCWLCGVLAGSLAVGLHYNQFRRLNNTVIYEDTWDPLTMLFISSFQYTVSVIAYISGSVSSTRHLIPVGSVTTHTIREMVCGLMLGVTLAWLWKQVAEYQTATNGNYLTDFPRVTLIGVDIMLLIRHSWPSYCRPDPISRPFGSQTNVMDTRGSSNTSIILLALSIMDSIPFRIIWLGIFLCVT